MIIRSIALAVMSAAACTAVPAVQAPAYARADAWRFVGQYRSLADCQRAGQGLVDRRAAGAYKCENDYAESGAPALDLYVR